MWYEGLKVVYEGADDKMGTLGGLMVGVNNGRRVERHKRSEDLGPPRPSRDLQQDFNRTLVSLASTNNKSDVFSPQ